MAGCTHNTFLVRSRVLRAKGGAGAVELGQAVIEACKSAKRANFRFLYPLHKTIKEKIEVQYPVTFHGNWCGVSGLSFLFYFLFFFFLFSLNFVRSSRRRLMAQRVSEREWNGGGQLIA